MRKEKDKEDVNAKERKQKIQNRLNIARNIIVTIIILAAAVAIGFMIWGFIEFIKIVEI